MQKSKKMINRCQFFQFFILFVRLTHQRSFSRIKIYHLFFQHVLKYVHVFWELFNRIVDLYFDRVNVVTNIIKLCW